MRYARSGFTLIEVLVAVTVLSVGVIAMAGSAATVT
ncbi:MAG: type IV pilus modification PilV family protein, partial [Gemmatimonadales bacterium]